MSGRLGCAGRVLDRGSTRAEVTAVPLGAVGVSSRRSSDVLSHRMPRAAPLRGPVVGLPTGMTKSPTFRAPSSPRERAILAESRQMFDALGERMATNMELMWKKAAEPRHRNLIASTRFHKEEKWARIELAHLNYIW